MAVGKIVRVTPDFDEAFAAVKELDPTPRHVLVFPADQEPAFEPVQATYTELM